jgi:hypothetical protein
MSHGTVYCIFGKSNLVSCLTKLRIKQTKTKSTTHRNQRTNQPPRLYETNYLYTEPSTANVTKEIAIKIENQYFYDDLQKLSLPFGHMALDSLGPRTGSSQ